MFQHDDSVTPDVPKPSGVRDPALGPRSNGSVLMMLGTDAEEVNC